MKTHLTDQDLAEADAREVAHGNELLRRTDVIAMLKRFEDGADDGKINGMEARVGVALLPAFAKTLDHYAGSALEIVDLACRDRRDDWPLFYGSDGPALTVGDLRDLSDMLHAAFARAPEDDASYELGKRDGYESAVQDFDLATGGDGEFKGSTIPGETVDVPAMKARVLGRFATLTTTQQEA